MKYCSLMICLMMFLTDFAYSQNPSVTLEVKLKDSVGTLDIQQVITLTNHSKDTLNHIYLYDWNQGFASRDTPLAERFGEEFNRDLHLAKDKERGYTNIKAITDKNFRFLEWKRTPEEDLVRIQLQYPLYPGQTYELRLTYSVKLPFSGFTGYGKDGNGDYSLRYWYLLPAFYDNGWQLHSHKNLDDMSQSPTDYSIHITYPSQLTLISDLDETSSEEQDVWKRKTLTGKGRSDISLFLQKDVTFEAFIHDNLTLFTSIATKEIDPINKTISTERVLDFIAQSLGSYPHQKLMISETEYRKHPLYGINQLPSFIRPYTDSFQYEMKLLKSALQNYLSNTLFFNRREDHWVYEGIQTYLMMTYVDRYYPNMKLLGKLSDTWLLRSFRLAQLDYNDQYPFLYMLMARKNLHEPLVKPLDSLIKFNEKIAGKYKAGVGLHYLDAYLGEEIISESIHQFYKQFLGKPTRSEEFEKVLKTNSSRNIDWFFEEFVESNQLIDYRIKKLRKDKDSIYLTIENRTGTRVPITLSAVDDNDSLMYDTWLEGISDERVIGIKRNGAKRFALNYHQDIPEFNQRNNWKTASGFLSTNKKLKFQFFKDAEDPFYYQVFYVPIVNFNIYDGFTPGIRLYNKTFLERPFIYDVQPAWAVNEKTLVGSGRLSYQKYFQEGSMYVVTTGVGGASFHYAENLRYTTITPYVSMGFRGKDLRSNERQFMTLRFVNVLRETNEFIETDPDYSVFNARYNYTNNGIIEYKSWFADLQVANEFAKVALNWEYRKLFQNNRQLNLRFFAGKFVYNQTNSDFFSFALDRPTDYLFDYNYLGRSEESGLSSQQIIIAEGGFKSKLEDQFASDWMVTGNASINLWRWIEVYGDIGMIKDRFRSPSFVYDSGIRLNLVTDYFELYFPMYSSNGWEMGEPNYGEKIRFIITLSPRTLTGLFTRKWF